VKSGVRGKLARVRPVLDDPTGSWAREVRHAEQGGQTGSAGGLQDAALLDGGRRGLRPDDHYVRARNSGDDGRADPPRRKKEVQG